MKKEKASITARKVAMGIVTLSIKPGQEQRLPEGMAEATEQVLIAGGVVGKRTIKWAKKQLSLKIYNAFDWILPGQFEALGERKAFCERQVTEAIEAGANQVLVLGAGYDTLCWRLSERYPEVTFIEIDHPATAKLKRKAINALGNRTNLQLIAKDLGHHPLVDVLNELDAWDKQNKSVFVAEGLLMYLDAASVAALFKQCASVAKNNSRFVFSYIPSGDDQRLDAGRWTGLFLKLQKMIGEPWLWSIHPNQLDAYLSAYHWHTLVAQKSGVEYFVSADLNR